jgi:hypothetical protein
MSNFGRIVAEDDWLVKPQHRGWWIARSPRNGTKEG